MVRSCKQPVDLWSGQLIPDGGLPKTGHPLRSILGPVIAAAGILSMPATIADAAPDVPASVRVALEAPRSPQDEAHTRWMGSIERLAAAATTLEGWVALEEKTLPDLLARASAYLQVQLRDTLAASERWLAGLVDGYAVEITVPDLTILAVEPVRGIDSSGFGWREDPINRSKKFHKGADYRADRGTPVYAAGDGVIVFCGRQSGYGKVIYVDHGGGLITRYAHLSSIDVTRGDVVSGDAMIGKVGSTGRTTGPHLHFEVRLDGRAVDPNLALELAEMQRTQPAEIVRLAAMALLPEAQRQSVDDHDPPAGMKKKSKNRPERVGRTRRAKPLS